MSKIKIFISVFFCLCFLLFTNMINVNAAYENNHANTGNQREDIVAVAETQIGYHEGANNETKYNHWLGKISGYPANGYGYPWCHAFVSWCANQANIPKSIVPYTAGTSVGKNFFVNDDVALWEVSAAYGGGYSPQRGDIIYFGSGSSPSHVGIVTNCSGGTVYTVEGNSSDQVIRRSYSLSNSYIIGYGVPNYQGGETNKWYSGLNPVNFGDTFYAYIINKSFWKMATMDSNKNISLRSEKRCGNQLWKFVRQGNGSYVIYNGENAEYRYVLDSTGVSTPEANVYAYKGYDNSSAAQRWFIYEKDGGYFLRSEITDCVLDVDGGHSDDGTNIWMYTYNGSNAQKFEIYREDDLWYRNMSPCNLGNDFYAFIINNSMWKHLTKDADNNVTLRTETGDDNQFWRFVRQSDGTYAIYNGENGEFKFVLDSTETHEAEANVYAYPEFVNGEAQKWYIHGKSCEYLLHTQSTDCVLDVHNNQSDDGTNIKMYNFNDTAAQKFEIYKIQLRKITFDANGGKCNTKKKNTAYESKYGTLPVPTRDDYDFKGWYTSKTGGTKITSNSKVTVTNDQTLYAQWIKKEKPVINLSAETATNKTKLYWDKVKDAAYYGLRIYAKKDDTYEQYKYIEPYYDLSYVENLPLNDYYASIAAIYDDKSYIISDKIYFSTKFDVSTDSAKGQKTDSSQSTLSWPKMAYADHYSLEIYKDLSNRSTSKGEYTKYKTIDNYDKTSYSDVYEAGCYKAIVSAVYKDKSYRSVTAYFIIMPTLSVESTDSEEITTFKYNGCEPYIEYRINIYNEDGTEFGRFITDEKKSYSLNIPAGNYYANVNFRTKAMEDYEIDSENVYFSVEQAQVTVTATEPPVSVTLWADPTLDNSNSVADLILINKYFVGGAELSQQAIANCDLNGNGVLDSMDCIYMLQLLVGKISLNDLPIITA